MKFQANFFSFLLSGALRGLCLKSRSDAKWKGPAWCGSSAPQSAHADLLLFVITVWLSMLGSSQGPAHWPLIHSFTRNVCSLPSPGLYPAVRLPSLQGTRKKKKKNPQRLPRCVAPPTHARATERQHRAAAGGQVCSLSSHKDNTIILKRSWSPVIEFSKGSGLLRGGGGQLLECGGSRGRGGGQQPWDQESKRSQRWMIWNHGLFCSRNLKHIGDLARSVASHLGEICRGGRLLVVLTKAKLESDRGKQILALGRDFPFERYRKASVISTFEGLGTQSRN